MSSQFKQLHDQPIGNYDECAKQTNLAQYTCGNKVLKPGILLPACYVNTTVCHIKKSLSCFNPQCGRDLVEAYNKYVGIAIRITTKAIIECSRQQPSVDACYGYRMM